MRDVSEPQAKTGPVYTSRHDTLDFLVLNLIFSLAINMSLSKLVDIIKKDFNEKLLLLLPS